MASSDSQTTTQQTGRDPGATTPATVSFWRRQPLWRIFAFLLALPTLGTATVYELLKERQILFAEIGLLNLSLGLLVSFAVGLLVIASFLRYLRGHGLLLFALYRVGLALAVLWLMRS